MESNYHIARLLLKSLTGPLSKTERSEVEAWENASASNKLFADELKDPQWLQEQLAIFDPQLLGESKLQALLLTKKKITAGEPAAFINTAYEDPFESKKVHFLKTTWFRAAAAIIILVAGIGIYYLSTRPEPQTTIVQTQEKPSPDILPGSDKAILTLSDGSKIELRNATSETINDGTLSIKNENGQLVYNDPARGSISPAGGSGAGGAEGGSRGSVARIAMNTMSTPKGGQYKLTLADGTNVWLNAASSITYPTAFNGETREVSVTGEAYFEVSKNKEKPFIVRTPEDQVTVLGTSFNINTYPDEIPKTTLVSGSIMMTRASAGALARTDRTGTVLRPGEAYSNGKITQTNISQDVAWKNGVFNFDNLPAEAALRQFARWYDVEIVYDGKPPTKTLGGKMGRNLTLQQALKVLEGVIARFRLEGKTLHVSPL